MMKTFFTTSDTTRGRWLLKALIGIIVAYVIWSVGFVVLHAPVTRWYLLRMANHEEIARACLNILTQPEYSNLVTKGFTWGSDTHLPFALQRLDIKSGIEISTNAILICKTREVWLRFRQSKDKPDEYDLILSSPSEIRPEEQTLLCTIRKGK